MRTLPNLTNKIIRPAHAGRTTQEENARSRGVGVNNVRPVKGVLGSIPTAHKSISYDTFLWQFLWEVFQVLF